VKFSVSNREMLDLLAGEGGDLRGQDDIGVTVQLANGTQFGPVGAIEYIENLADDATDTVTAFARFDNPERRLVPGGTVSVTVSSKSGVLRTAIPPTAVLQDTQGPYVWAVGADGKAERRTIARGDLVGDWLFVEKGLKKGDRIVADGAHRVSRGMTVKAAPASKR
jgi:membrane fusion protein (multidrug efflux system)